MKKLKIALAILGLCCLLAFAACVDNPDSSADQTKPDDTNRPNNPDPDENNSPDSDEIQRILVENGYNVWTRNLADVTDAEEKFLITQYCCTGVMNAQRSTYVYNAKLELYFEVYTYSISVFWFESDVNAQKAYEFALKEYVKFNGTTSEEMADYFYVNGNMVAFGSLETIAFVKAAVEQAK